MAAKSALTTTQKSCHKWVWASPLGRGLLAMMVVGSLGWAGCDRSPQTPPDDSPPTPPPTTVVPNPEATSPGAPNPEAPTAAESLPQPSEPTAQAPTTTPTVPAQGDTLPNTLVQQWEPMSDVLLTFGPMTVTPGQITWGSGQTSPYTLVSRDGGFLLKLETNPAFYDIPNPYLKLMPQTDAAGAITSLEVAFYEGEAQAQQDNYIMYGSYFMN